MSGSKFLPRKTVNGKHDHPLYHIWTAMLGRCYYPRTDSYKYYGRIGITVHKDFFDFNKFVKCLGGRPSKQHSLDRIDGNLGYTPANVRWEIARNQSLNRRSKNPKNSRGVYWIESNTSWRSAIRVNYKLIHLGYYSSKKEAALAYNIAAIKYNGKYAQLNQID